MQVGVGGVVDNPFLIANPSLQTGLDPSFAVIEQFFDSHANKMLQLEQRVKSLKLKMNTLEDTMTRDLLIQETHFAGNMDKFDVSIDKLKREIKKLKIKLQTIQEDRGDMVIDMDDSDDEPKPVK